MRLFRHAHRTDRAPEHPRLVARNKFHVDGEHRVRRADSPHHYYSCLWCDPTQASTNPLAETEVFVVPGDYPNGIAGFFGAYQDALRGGR